MGEDIRWKQRFDNFGKAFLQLKEAVDLYGDRAEVESIIKEGLIQRFEFTHELAWKVLKDYLEYEGHQNINGSRSATRAAFNIDLIDNGQVWMDMIESRNKTVHTYHKNILNEEFEKINHSYFACFSAFNDKFTRLL
ncbi:MAG: nucleotidyltransferase substrate binding protein [Gammaproteobacteria bacterium]|nr:nucleotidyltransferase substrate binding protein [Gammaproteobacteria bacterium]